MGRRHTVEQITLKLCEAEVSHTPGVPPLQAIQFQAATNTSRRKTWHCFSETHRLQARRRLSGNAVMPTDMDPKIKEEQGTHTTPVFPPYRPPS